MTGCPKLFNSSTNNNCPCNFHTSPLIINGYRMMNLIVLESWQNPIISMLPSMKKVTIKFVTLRLHRSISIKVWKQICRPGLESFSCPSSNAYMDYAPPIAWSACMWPCVLAICKSKSKVFNFSMLPYRANPIEFRNEKEDYIDIIVSEK